MILLSFFGVCLWNDPDPNSSASQYWNSSVTPTPPILDQIDPNELTREKSEPLDILMAITNKWWIEQTHLNKVSWEQTNTVINVAKSLSEQITPYLNWLTYLSIMIAVILITFLWFRLVTANGNDSVISGTKEKLQSIIIGVLVIFWFASILKIVTLLMSAF